MAGSHIGSTVLNIEEEQKEIDELISSLLDYKPASKDTPVIQRGSPKARNTPTTANKSTKGRGRPPRTKPPVPARSPSLPQDTIAPPEIPSMGLLITCIEKLNNQNKVLLNRVKELDAKVESQCSSGPLNSVNNIASSEVSVSPTPQTPVSSDVLKSVVEKVDKIEDSINSRILICRGPEVSKKIISVTENSAIDFGKLKAQLCADICGSEVTKIGVSSFGISLFGRNRNSIKIDCNNISIKKFLLSQIRSRKPEGIYLVDFLSPDKRRIHNKLVALKKENPSIVKAVYVRGGVIYAKINQDTVKFDCFEDIRSIGIETPIPENSPGGTPPNIPEENTPDPDPSSPTPQNQLDNGDSI